MIEKYATRWREAAPRPQGIVNRLRSVLRSAVLHLRGRAARIEGDSFLRCFYCHYVFDDQVAQFRSLLSELQTIGTFVDTPTALRMLSGETPIDGRYFHLSFDDGFRNIRTNAAPILKELGIPAIAFVPSLMLEADWETTRRYCLEVTRYPAVIEMMTWDEARELPEFGVEIGSHTQTHARLSAISGKAEHLRHEILDSKSDLEEKLGVECRYISWPYGEAGDIDEAAIAVVREAAYDGCFSAVRGTVEPGVSDIMKIPRHHFEVQWPASHVRFFLAGNHEA